MSYTYANTIFDLPSQASRAAVESFMYSDSNSDSDVAAMTAKDIAAEIVKEGWDVPYLEDHTYTVEDLAQQVIDYANSAS